MPGPGRPGEKVLLVLEGAIESALIGDLLVALGASVARAKLKDAERIAKGAALMGVPFRALLTDRAAFDSGAARLLSLLAEDGSPARQPRAVVIIDSFERGDIPRFRSSGFNGYLMRPIRPLSLLTQLFGDGEEEKVRRPEAVSRIMDGAGGVPADTAHISILLAEDNDINALLARTILEKGGARVVRVRNGIEAIAKARTELAGPAKGFDLVLMDIHMPGMDGVEAARHIRALYPADALPAAGRPPIIALTANAFAADRASYLHAGLDDYLAKPFEKEDLAALLERWRGSKSTGLDRAGRGAA
ncbi:MAG: response regulator [Methyloceanibacter sp.]|uniref:response regulator n=1 Tax=Methyloceanibacter sp. TaxID=1965321 RepID=UPI003D9B245D